MRTARSEPVVRFGAYAHFGRLAQTASDSFTASMGGASGTVFGGGVEVAFLNGLFVRGDVSRFGADGERIEIVEDDVVPLGIPLSISLWPIEVTGGYRFRAWQPGGPRGRLRLLPYAGAGAGVLRYRESSGGDVPEESVSDTFTSWHLLAGVDLPLGRRVSVGVELHRRWVPDGLGGGGVSQIFGETDLGGTSVRTRIRFGF